MKRVLVVGEDALSCALGERLVGSAMPGWSLVPPINTKGVTKLISGLPRYIEQARYVRPVVCVADTDGSCVKTLLARWVQTPPPTAFHLRLAVTEAESWVLADRDGFARYVRVSLNRVPSRTDDIQDPSAFFCKLFRDRACDNTETR